MVGSTPQNRRCYPAQTICDKSTLRPAISDPGGQTQRMAERHGAPTSLEVRPFLHSAADVGPRRICGSSTECSSGHLVGRQRVPSLRCARRSLSRKPSWLRCLVGRNGAPGRAAEARAFANGVGSVDDSRFIPRHGRYAPLSYWAWWRRCLRRAFLGRTRFGISLVNTARRRSTAGSLDSCRIRTHELPLLLLDDASMWEVRCERVGRVALGKEGLAIRYFGHPFGDRRRGHDAWGCRLDPAIPEVDPRLPQVRNQAESDVMCDFSCHPFCPWYPQHGLQLDCY